MGRKPNPVPNVRRIFTMRPDDAVKLSDLREKLGMTSEAAVLRYLIREAHKRHNGA